MDTVITGGKFQGVDVREMLNDDLVSVFRQSNATDRALIRAEQRRRFEITRLRARGSRARR
jgi:hypothetical protein